MPSMLVEKVPTEVRWKVRSARMLSRAFVPRPLRRQAVHLAFYGGPNFGDALSPMVTAFAFGGPVVEAHCAGADLAAVGSILEVMEKYVDGSRPYVWGSGFIRDGGAWRGRPIRPVAVRGALTRSRLDSSRGDAVALGDPGLLVRRMFPALRESGKRFNVSLIPHIRERYSKVVSKLRVERPDINVIDPGLPPAIVLERISASRLVLSSSLHGLICSDALDVPNRWTPLSGNVEGGAYKFRDYYSAFGEDAQPVALSDALRAGSAWAAVWEPREGLERVIDELIDVFPRVELRRRYRL